MNKNNNSLKNFTPHAIRIGSLIIPSEGIARVRENVTPGVQLEFEIGTLPTSNSSYGAVEGLPSCDTAGAGQRTYYIVSAMTASAIRATGDTRPDLLCPGEPVWDEVGKVIGCKSLRWA